MNAGGGRPGIRVAAVLVAAVLMAVPAWAQGDMERRTWIASAEPRDPGPRELLERARSRYERLGSMTASFEQTVTVALLDQESHGTGRWYQKGPGRFKMDFAEPPEDVIVADGEHLWLYYPSTHPGQVIRTTIEANATGRGMADLQGRIFQEARHGYRIEDGGDHQVSGTRTSELILTPMEGTRSPYRRVRVWVGKSDLLVRKFEIVEENETVRTVRLWDLEPDAAVADSVFRFRVPAGVDVFEG